MGNKDKLVREQLDMVEQELREAGIGHWRVSTRRRSSHTMVLFEVKGKPERIMFSGSSDPKAILRTRSTLRQILRGQVPGHVHVYGSEADERYRRHP